MADDEEYEVGYGRPPQETKFVKGKSGNPSGRPKGSRNTYKLLEDILEQKVTVTQDGKPVKISKKMAILLQTVNSAARGEIKEIQTLLPHMLALDSKNEEREKASENMAKDDKSILEQFIKDNMTTPQEPESDDSTGSS